MPDEHRFLVVEILADALVDAYGAAFEFQHAEREAVDVEHDVGPLAVFAAHAHFFGDGEAVVVGVFPIDEPDRLPVFAQAFLHFHAVAQQPVHLFVDFVEAPGLVARCALQFEYRFIGKGIAVMIAEVFPKLFFLDIAVFLPVLPVAEIAPPQLGLEKPDDPVLRDSFPLSDLAHAMCFIEFT